MVKTNAMARAETEPKADFELDWFAPDASQWSTRVAGQAQVE